MAMYHGVNTVIRTAYGNTENVEVNVGIHQESGLCPLLFLIVMEAISCEFRTGLPWELLHAGATLKQQKSLNYKR